MKTTTCQCNAQIELTHQANGIRLGFCESCQKQVTDDIVVDWTEFATDPHYNY